ncbi:MAG TPA: sigma-54 dependent transcriptional regulator [Acidobacteriaceae bacterium]|nr:sigma-54 dependent transcriptional regulator [Acidobacteriaceae bacterium]
MATPLVQHRDSFVPPQRFDDQSTIQVLVVSPNTKLRQQLQEKLSPSRWRMCEAASGAAALEMLRIHGSEDRILLLDPMLPDLEANGFNAIVRDRFPQTQVLMLNSQTGQLLIGTTSPTPISIRLADEVNRGGAAASTAAAAAMPEAPRSRSEAKVGLRSMIGNSDAMQRTFSVTRLVAGRNTTVLVTGESGTGKDLIAQELHLMSPRRNQPFVVVNCSAIPEALLEAELFGFAKGSFTGAVQSRIGRIHAAQGGTLFLDEIGDMPLSLQSKILRFLEQGEVQRIGGNDNLKVDVRVVAATNADLKGMVAKQQFREDLYYRLAVFPIQLPPLRERMSDLEPLAISFCAKFVPGTSLSREALAVLQQHHWPGNVRELRNTIERATILAAGEAEIKAEHILL